MNFWYLFTLGGEKYTVIAILLLIYAIYFFRRWRGYETKKLKCFVIFFTISIFVIIGLVYVIKDVTNIPRPCTPCISGIVANCNPYCPLDKSFPSGHSAVTFGIVTILLYFYKRRKIALLYIASFLVAISRYMLGVHTVVDIVAGSILGIAVPILIYELFKNKYFESD